MNDLDWARERAAYLQRARQRAGAHFDTVVELFMGGHYVGHEWFEEGKACAQSLHRLSLELVEDAGIPGRSFSLPADFLGALDAYENAVQDLQDSMTARVEEFMTQAHGRIPYEAQELTDLLQTQLAIVRHVRSTAPSGLRSGSTSG